MSQPPPQQSAKHTSPNLAQTTQTHPAKKSRSVAFVVRGVAIPIKQCLVSNGTLHECYTPRSHLLSNLMFWLYVCVIAINVTIGVIAYICMYTIENTHARAHT